MDWRPISADSHITEPPGCYRDHIEPAFRERAPHVVRHGQHGRHLHCRRHEDAGADGADRGRRRGAPGHPDRRREVRGSAPQRLGSRRRRLQDQDRDGVAAEIIYPTVGMLICNHPDFDYKKACFDAYNRWLQAYCCHAPDRLVGMGQTAMRTVAEGIADLERIKAMGFRGVMMPGNPGEKDYDDPAYDPFWEAAIALEMPLSWHILTTSGDNSLSKPRGPKINGFLSIIRGCQDIMGMLVFSGVFERHPALSVVCVEADAGWAPHFMYRMDHAYKRHRYWMKGKELAAAAVGIFPRPHRADVPGRLDGLPVRRPAGAQAAHVGQRFPAQRFDLAVESGRPRRADGPSRARSAQAHPSRQRGGALQAGGVAAFDIGGGG